MPWVGRWAQLGQLEEMVEEEKLSPGTASACI